MVIIHFQGEEMEVGAAVIEVFHLLPNTAVQFMDKLVSVRLQASICVRVGGFACSTYSLRLHKNPAPPIFFVVVQAAYTDRHLYAHVCACVRWVHGDQKIRGSPESKK